MSQIHQVVAPAALHGPPAASQPPLFKHDPTAAELPAVYEGTWSAQRDIIKTPGEPARVVHGLRRVDDDVRRALRPWAKLGRTPTPDEVGKAIIALSALKTYLALEAPTAHSTRGPKPKN